MKLLPFFSDKNPLFIPSFLFFPEKNLYILYGSQAGTFRTSTPSGISLIRSKSNTGNSPFSTVKTIGSQLKLLRYFTNFNHLCTPAPPLGGQ